MQTLDLECPSCGEMLELDAGFAGGVCRCSSCGTLMTVPADAGQAETLSRPSPSGGSASLPELPRPSRTRNKKGKASKGGAISATIEAGEYRTASGKVIRLDDAVKVPMAESKRKKVQALTAIVFFSVIAGVVVLAVIAIIMMVGGPDKAGLGGLGGGDGPPVFDATANPYTLPFANVAGLPVDEEVAIVFGATEDSGEWMIAIADMIRAGLDKEESSTRVGFYAAIKGSTTSYGVGPEALDRLDAKKSTEWIIDLPNEDPIDLADALSTAMSNKPTTLILVIGSATEAEVTAWKGAVGTAEDVTVHAVMINGTSLPLRAWLKEREGSELVSLSSQDIDSWQFLAESESGSDSGE